MEDKIIMIMDDGTEAECTVLETTSLGGVDYILVTDAPEDEDGECYLMKDMSEPEDEEALYVDVENEEEREAVMNIFEEMLKDEISIEKQ